LELKNAMNQNHAEPSMTALEMGVKYGKMGNEMEELRQQINKIYNAYGTLFRPPGINGMKDEMTFMRTEMGQLKDQIARGINGQQIPLKFDSIELKKNKLDLVDSAYRMGFANNELIVTSRFNGLF